MNTLNILAGAVVAWVLGVVTMVGMSFAIGLVAGPLVGTMFGIGMGLNTAATCYRVWAEACSSR